MDRYSLICLYLDLASVVFETGQLCDILGFSIHDIARMSMDICYPRGVLSMGERTHERDTSSTISPNSVSVVLSPFWSYQ